MCQEFRVTDVTFVIGVRHHVVAQEDLSWDIDYSRASGDSNSDGHPGHFYWHIRKYYGIVE